MRFTRFLATGLALLVAGCGGQRNVADLLTAPIPITGPAPAPTSDVTIEVRDALGGAVADADLQVASTEPVGGYLQVTYGNADASGRMTFRHLTPGTYVVAARSRGNVAADSLRVVSANSPVTRTLELVKPGVFRGRAMLEGQINSDGVLVSCLAAVLNFTGTDASGAFRLAGVPPGHWTVDFSSPGFQPAHTEGTIASPGDSASLSTVTLVRGRPATSSGAATRVRYTP